jgi:hypothetical protein
MGANYKPVVATKLAKVALRRASELARTGECSNWIQIEKILRSEGFLDPNKVLADQFTRDYLNQSCARAQARGGFLPRTRGAHHVPPLSRLSRSPVFPRKPRVIDI